MLNFTVDNAKSILSSTVRVFKTDAFIKETAHFRDIDKFLTKIQEVAAANLAALPQGGGGIKVETDRAHAFFFTVIKHDIVFYKYSGREEFVRRNDPYLTDILRKPSFNVTFNPIRATINALELKKLYRLSGTEAINFPLLNENQQKIVFTEDKNVLVQGVAGSGKTNVCIDKIIYSACQGYAGRVLYTTFSRGLLTDTKLKVMQFHARLTAFISDFTMGKIEFADENHKLAIENRLGIYFTSDDDDRILEKVKSVAKFLETNVDYMLLEDFYFKRFGEAQIADENYFVNTYVRDIKNHQLSGKLDKVKYLSFEVIYKEIFGVIFGCFDPKKPKDMLAQSEYAFIRRDSFSSPECEVIYSLARDYSAHLFKNGMVDNNSISRALLSDANTQKYAIAIIDEVQDLTEVSLCFYKQIARKVFAVGDALQMINPSYFSFAYLKRLLFEKDIVAVAELAHNYRNTQKIAEIIENLSKINTQKFGVHSFVLKNISVESDAPTSAVKVSGKGFLEEVNKQNFNNYTVVVAGVKEKELLRKTMKKQEILTVAEIKGLEREVVIAYNLLSSNLDKWNTLERTTVNRKQADENSVFRYYFNIFYVGVSRAKTHIFVAEDSNLDLFNTFFIENFEKQDTTGAINALLETSNIIEVEQDELATRIAQFINLEQYENARFAAAKILNDSDRAAHNDNIDISEQLIRHGKHREAGIAFWEKGYGEEAKKQFILSDDTILCDLIDAAMGGNNTLDIGILDFLEDVSDPIARKLIFDVIKKDVESVKERQKHINQSLKKLKGK